MRVSSSPEHSAPARAPRTALRTAVLTVLGGFTVALLLTAPAGSATAADEAGETVQWSIGPTESVGGDARTTIDYTIEPGVAISDAVRVANLGEEELTLDLYAADALATADGTFTVAPAAQESVALGSWITPEVSSVRLGPGESTEVPVTIAIPENGTPGDHAGGILAARSTGGGDGGVSVSVDQRVGTRGYVRVNGDLAPRLEVTSLDVDYGGAMWPVRRGPAHVSYTVTNTGNVRLAGSATVSLRAPFGLPLGSSEPIEVVDLLPGGSIDGTIDLAPAVAPGRLTAVVDVDAVNLAGTVPLEVPHERAQATIWAVPWLALGVLALLVAAWWLRRHRLTRALRAARTELAGLRHENAETPVPAP